MLLLATLAIALWVVYRWVKRMLTRAVEFCEAEAAACQARLDEMDSEERRERRERLARLPRDPFPRPGGPAIPASPR